MTSIHIFIEELMLSTNISVYCVIMQKQNMICLQEKKNSKRLRGYVLL